MRPVEPKQLRAHFLDRHRGAVPERTLDVVAHMLFELDRTERVVELGLGHLADTLGVGRVDVSFGHPRDPLLVPRGQVRRGGPWPSLVGLELPNLHDVFQRVWRRSDPVAFDDVVTNDSLGSLKAAFLETGARAMLAQRLRDARGTFGIVCADDMEEGRTWQACHRDSLSSFTRLFLGPILGLSRDLAVGRGCKPSPAELDAVRLAAEGASYRAIAAALDKSVRTVEAQLRSARRKTGAANQAELVRLCQPWL